MGSFPSFDTYIHHNNLINFQNISGEILNKLAKQHMKNILEFNDNIVQLDENKLSFWKCFGYGNPENPTNPIIQTINTNGLKYSFCKLCQIHPDEQIRTKCVELNKKINLFEIEQNARNDVYQVYWHYWNNQYQKESEKLTIEQNKYITNTMNYYKTLGFNLDLETREIITQIDKKLISINYTYLENITNINMFFDFDLEQLDGMDVKWLSDRKIILDNDYKYRVKLELSDYLDIMEYCKIRETRKFIGLAIGSRCSDINSPNYNLSNIYQIIKLRKQKTNLLRFKSYSDYKLSNTSAKNSQTVIDFQNKLYDLVKPLVKSEKEKLVEIAKELDGLEEFEFWDRHYYSRIYTEKESNLSKIDLKKMFSINSVSKGIMNFCEELLDLKFVDITKHYPNSLYSHSHGISLYVVYDGSNINNSIPNPLGYFYLDLFARPGKTKKSKMITLVPKSQFNLPICVLVCNFESNTNLDFNNVVNYFHEFGHLMHMITSTNQIASLSGVNCQSDFVETPS